MFFPVSLPPLARHSRKESCFPRHPFQQLSTWNVWSQSSPTLTPDVCPVLTPPPRYSCLASLASALPPTRSGWTPKLSHVCSVTNPLEAQRHHGPFLPASTWFTVVVPPLSSLPSRSSSLRSRGWGWGDADGLCRTATPPRHQLWLSEQCVPPLPLRGNHPPSLSLFQ